MTDAEYLHFVTDDLIHGNGGLRRKYELPCVRRQTDASAVWKIAQLAASIIDGFCDIPGRCAVIFADARDDVLQVVRCVDRPANPAHD